MEGNNKYDELALLSISTVAKILKVGKARIYGFINNKQINTVDLNGVIRIPYFEIRKCIENLYVKSTYVNSEIERTNTKKTIITNPKHIMDNIKKSRAIK